MTFTTQVQLCSMKLKRIIHLFSSQQPDPCPPISTPPAKKRSMKKRSASTHAVPTINLEQSRRQYWSTRVNAHPSTSTDELTSFYKQATPGVQSKKSIGIRRVTWTDYLDWSDEEFRRAHSMEPKGEVKVDSNKAAKADCIVSTTKQMNSYKMVPVSGDQQNRRGMAPIPKIYVTAPDDETALNWQTKVASIDIEHSSKQNGPMSSAPALLVMRPFPPVPERKCNVATDRETYLQALTQISQELASSPANTEPLLSSTHTYESVNDSNLETNPEESYSVHGQSLLSTICEEGETSIPGTLKDIYLYYGQPKDTSTPLAKEAVLVLQQEEVV